MENLFFKNRYFWSIYWWLEDDDILLSNFDGWNIDISIYWSFSDIYHPYLWSVVWIFEKHECVSMHQHDVRPKVTRIMITFTGKLAGRLVYHFVLTYEWEPCSRLQSPYPTNPRSVISLKLLPDERVISEAQTFSPRWIWRNHLAFYFWLIEQSYLNAIVWTLKLDRDAPSGRFRENQRF